MVHEITAKDVNAYLASFSSYSARTRNHERTQLAVAFNFAIQNEYCEKNPAEMSVRSKEIAPPVGILQPEQLARLLSNAPASQLPAMAIGAFAGLRTSEIGKLDWQQIDLDGGYIEVTAKNSKRRGVASSNSSMPRCVDSSPVEEKRQIEPLEYEGQ